MTRKKKEEQTISESSPKSIEEALARIDIMIEKLENADTPLEEMFQIYEEGMKLLAEANRKINKVEKDLILLDENLE